MLTIIIGANDDFEPVVFTADNTAKNDSNNQSELGRPPLPRRESLKLPLFNSSNNNSGMNSHRGGSNPTSQRAEKSDGNFLSGGKAKVSARASPLVSARSAPTPAQRKASEELASEINQVRGLQWE